jgi:cell division septation protein DedD
MKFSVVSLASMIAVLPLYVHALPSIAARQAAGAGTVGTTDITTNATANNPDIQSSLTLDSSVIATGFEQNGQAVQEAGQVPSLTSSNNFINFCATTNQPLTNGLQIKTGSCNPAPMGQIPATTAMPSAKFQFPSNFGTIPANQAFTITMNINNLETGNFVNAEANYFAAPQQLNSAGQIVGHSHVVVEAINGLNDTTPSNPQTFAFFKGLNDPAANGQLTAAVSAGLPPGTYRLASINTAANHQPALVPVAQHGTLDDMVYFTVSGGADANNATAQAEADDQGSVGNAVSAAAAAASSAAAATGGVAAGAAAAAAGAATAPSATAPPPATVPPAAPKSAAKLAVKAGAYGIQLGAFKSSADAANRRWAHLTKEYPKLLAGLSPTVSPKKGASGTLYRLQVTGLTEKHARALCKSLKAKSQGCVLTRAPTGGARHQ